MPDEYLTVDMYILDQYVGKRKVGINSIAGLLLVKSPTIRLPDRKTTFKHPADAKEADSGPTPDGGPSERSDFSRS